MKRRRRKHKVRIETKPPPPPPPPLPQQQQQNNRPKDSIERGGDEADDAATGTTLPHFFYASKIKGPVNYP